MKSFYNGHPQDKRTISIEVDKDFVLFYFDNVLRQFREEQKHNEELGYDEEGLEKEPTYFYWIPKEEWVRTNEHLVSHMNRKAWFTPEMEQYINQETK